MGAKANGIIGEVTYGGSLMHEAKPDFSGYATKAGLKCSDGRIIMPDAFKHQDKMQVPLVWQHSHDEPGNVLGHAILEHRQDGVYAYGYFNDTDQAKNAKTLVEHKDITSLSIFANQLTEKAKQVLHGFIREVSLVLAGANPGALIDNITLQHGDGEMVTLDDEAVIYTGLELNHADGSSSSNSDNSNNSNGSNSSGDGPTVQEVYDSMTDQQKEVVHFMVGAALESGSSTLTDASHSSTTSDDKGDKGNNGTSDSNTNVTHSDNGDNERNGRHMSRNVFEQQNEGRNKEGEKRHVLTHDAIRGIVDDAQKRGSLKEAVEAYAIKHGIDNIDLLFPDAKTITDSPEFDSRRVEWVAGVINGTRHSPFSRIKSLVADITHDEARARGYIKGTLKKEEFFGLTRRITTPTTIYKKQKLDRDDIIDITDLDVVAWLKAEMRVMLDEELARAVLIGDGRAVDDEDKIKDPAGATEGAGIRAIANDHDLYAATITSGADITTDAGRTALVEQIMLDMKFYKGSGQPTFYTTLGTLTNLLLTKDGMGRRLWRTAGDLAAEIGVSSIVTVEVMEQQPDLIGIIVNLKDYAIGTDRGGDVTFFDDFDIDYNQYKYLLETRCSGALTKIRSALVVRAAEAGDTLAEPAAPTFDPATNNVTIVDTAGVVYTRTDTNAVVTAAGSPYAVADGTSLTIQATPDATHYFENNVEDQWTFENPAGA